MLREFILNNPHISADALRSFIFKAVEAEVSNIIIPCGLIQTAIDIYPDAQYTAIVGYPYGIESLEVKVHEIMEAAKKGIKTFDLVLNEFHIQNLEYNKICKEYTAVAHICKDYKAELRGVIENRLVSQSRSVKMASLLGSNGLDTIVIGTGNMPQNIADGITICYKIMQETRLNPIVYAHSWSERHLEILEKAGGKVARSPYL